VVIDSRRIARRSVRSAGLDWRVGGSGWTRSVGGLRRRRRPWIGGSVALTQVFRGVLPKRLYRGRQADARGSRRCEPAIEGPAGIES
jgi:hypothetical protein